MHAIQFQCKPIGEVTFCFLYNSGSEIKCNGINGDIGVPCSCGLFLLIITCRLQFIILVYMYIRTLCTKIYTEHI